MTPDIPRPPDRPANRLARETSPYLLQHAHNPVEWYPWGDEAFAKARAEDRPILLSVGYATCHWCHVMERESFEDPALARQLADGFVAIKVDREELPDVVREAWIHRRRHRAAGPIAAGARAPRLNLRVARAG